MCKYFKYFLIFMIFFNCLFFTIEDTSATSFSSQEAGPRDRIRNYNILSKEKGNFIEYKYNEDDGFSCYPDGLKLYSFKNQKLNGTEGFIANLTFDLAMNVLFLPILCVGFLKSLTTSVKSGTVSSLIGGLGMIMIVFASSGLERLLDLIYAEDDYNLDPSNPSCIGLYLTTFVNCMLIVILFNAPLTIKLRFSVIFIVSVIVSAAVQAVKIAMYKKAQKVYDKLSLCGDNWLVYGSNELEEELKTTVRTTEDIEFKYLKKYFPTRGTFSGSYKRKLEDCFQNKNINTCEKLFSLEKGSLTDVNSIDNLASIVNKQYREYIYDGMEYEYSECKDPRPERKYYLNTNKETSQLYYFRGNDAANFACDRFLTGKTDDYKQAYKCCIEASQSLICISSKDRKNVNNSKDEKSGGNSENNSSENEKNTITSEFYTMCNKNDSAGSCSLKTNYDFLAENDISNTDDKQTCIDLKNTINKLETELNPDEEDGEENSEKSDNESIFEDIQEIYDTYCEKDGTPKIKTNFSDTLIAAQDAKGNGKKITFKIRRSAYNENKYCVETYNLCPYNFRILGGSENVSKQFMASFETGYKVKTDGNGNIVEDSNIEEVNETNTNNNCEFDEEGNRKCTSPCLTVKGDDEAEVSSCYNKPANFCQLDRHCVLIPDFFEKEMKASSPYIDNACIDLVGSSHNFYNYVSSPNSQHSRLFTAPFVECFVETFKNMLLNKAGHTKCISGGETAGLDNTCYSGEVYKKGDTLDESVYPSPFIKLKTYFRNIVKILLVLAVVLYGFNMIVLESASFNKEETFKMIFTITLVSYFTISNNWMNYVFNGIYTAMNTVAEFAMNISLTDNSTIGYDSNKYSGCYFFEHEQIPNNYSDYGSKKYIAVFDTLDCKMSRYFGFSTESITAPPILSYFIAGILSFGFVLILIIPFILVMVSLLFIAFRFSYQFIFNSLKLTILLFVSPIMIPMYLFKRTQGFFTSWIREVFSCVLNPLIIVISLSLFLLIFDKYFIGDAVFSGTREPIRDVYCGKICKIDENNFYYISEDDEDTAEKECVNMEKGKVINLNDKAPICASMYKNKATNSTSNLFDFVIDGFSGFPAVFGEAADTFPLFLSMMFLLLIILIFEEFNNNTGNIAQIFGSSGGGDTSGLPSLKDVLATTSKKIVAVSNKTLKIGKTALSTAYNGAHKGVDRIKRPKIEDKKDKKEKTKGNNNENDE